MEALDLVAWKIDKALFKALILDILLVSLLFFNISEGLIAMITILISRARMAITINNSMRVKEWLLSFDFKLNLDMKNYLIITIYVYY